MSEELRAVTSRASTTSKTEHKDHLVGFQGLAEGAAQAICAGATKVIDLKINAMLKFATSLLAFITKSMHDGKSTEDDYKTMLEQPVAPKASAMMDLCSVVLVLACCGKDIGLEVLCVCEDIVHAHDTEMEARKAFVMAVKLTWSSVAMATNALDYNDDHVAALVEYMVNPPQFVMALGNG